MTRELIKFIAAFRIDENTVGVMYRHNNRLIDFVIEWNNVHPETGEILDYDLQISCMSESEDFNAMICETIKNCENGDSGLYEELRDTFNAQECEEV